MPLTRAGIENEIVTAYRGILVNRFFTMSVLVNGSNLDLNGPIRLALRSLGGNTADPLVVADGDLADFAGWAIEQLIETAKVETLKACLGKCAFIDVRVGEDMQWVSQFAAQLRAEIALVEQRLIGGFNTGPANLARMTGHSMPNDPFDPCRTRSTYGNWPYP